MSPIPAWKQKQKPARELPKLVTDGPRHEQALALEAVARDPYCQRCPFGLNHTGNGCLWGNGPVPADGMIVYEQPDYWDIDKQRPLLGQVGSYFNAMLEEADPEFNRASIYITNAIKCKAGTRNIDRKDRALAQKACASYLEAEIEAVRPKVILAMGESAFYFFTHKPGGVVAARGEAVKWLSPWLDADGTPYMPWVIYTISPVMAMNVPAYERPYTNDVRKFCRYVQGKIEQPKVEIVEVQTAVQFNAVCAELWRDATKTLTFDLETRGFIAHQPHFSKVWCAAFTRGRLNADRAMRSFLIPLEHPDSPFLRLDGRCEPEVVRNVLRLIFQNKVSGHNVLFDLLHGYYLADRYGVDVDTLSPEPDVLDEALDAARAARPVWRAAERQRALDALKKPKQTKAKGEPRKRKAKGNDEAGTADAGTPTEGRKLATPRARRARAKSARTGGEDPADSRGGVGRDDAAGGAGDSAAPDGAGGVGAGAGAGSAGGEPAGSGAPAGAAAAIRPDLAGVHAA